MTSKGKGKGDSAPLPATNADLDKAFAKFRQTPGAVPVMPPGPLSSGAQPFGNPCLPAGAQGGVRPGGPSWNGSDVQLYFQPVPKVKEEPVQEMEKETAIVALEEPARGDDDTAQEPSQKRFKKQRGNGLGPEDHGPRKLVSRNGPKVRGYSREAVWPSGVAAVNPADQRSNVESGEVEQIDGTRAEHCPDGRCCNLCPAKDSDPDPVIPHLNHRWRSNPCRKTGKTQGNVCYYCQVNFRAKYASKSATLAGGGDGGTTITMDSLKTEAGKNRELHQELQRFKAKVVATKKEEWADFLEQCDGEHPPINNWDDVTNMLCTIGSMARKRPRFEVITRDNAKLVKDSGFAHMLRIKDDWWNADDYYRKFGDPRVNGLGHTPVIFCGEVGVIVKRAGPSGTIERAVWEGFSKKEDVMRSEDQIEDGDLDNTLDNLKKSWSTKIQPTGYSMDAILGTQFGAATGSTSFSGLPSFGGASTTPTSLALACGGLSAASSSTGESALFRAPCSTAAAVGQHPFAHLQPFNEQPPKDSAAAEGTADNKIKGRKKKTAQQQGSGQDAVQPLADGTAGDRVETDPLAEAPPGGKAPKRKRAAPVKARGRPKKDWIQIGLSLISDFEAATGEDSSMFSGTEWKVKQKALESSLVGIREHLQIEKQVAELEKLNKELKQLQVVDILTKKWREGEGTSAFFELMDAQRHFLQQPPEAPLNIPSFLNVKKVEVSVADAGVSPIKLIAALGKSALQHCGYTSDDQIADFQISLLQEVVVRISRDSTDVGKSLTETADPLSVSEQMTKEAKKQLLDLLSLRPAKLETLTVDNVDEIDAAISGVQDKTSLMCALAMFPPGRGYIDVARGQVKIIKDVQKRAGKVGTVLANIKDAQTKDGAKVNDLFAELLSIIAPCSKEAKEKIVFLHSAGMLDASRALCNIYGTGCLDMLRKVIDGERTAEDVYMEHQEAWDQACRLGKSYLGEKVSFLPNAEVFQDFMQCVVDILANLRLMVEMHKAKAGEKSSLPALELYHWLVQVAPQLFEDDGSLCLYMPKNPLLAKCKTFFETIGAGKNASAVTPGISKHFEVPVEKATDRLTELLNPYDARGGTALESTERLLPTCEMMHLSREDGDGPRQKQAALRLYLEMATKCELPKELFSELEGYGRQLGSSKMKKQLEFVQKMNGTFSAGAELCKILCGMDLNSHDSWMVSEMRIDLVAKAEERADALRKFVLDNPPTQLQPQKGMDILDPWIFDAASRTWQLLSNITDLISTWKARWVATFSQMMDTLEAMRPRPDMANIMNADQKQILMQPDKLLQLNPVARIVEQLTTTMNKKVKVMTIVSEERLQLAVRSRMEADACLGVAFVLAAMDENLPGMKTAAERTKFKASLLTNAKQKAFAMPECLTAELQRAELERSEPEPVASKPDAPMEKP